MNNKQTKKQFNKHRPTREKKQNVLLINQLMHKCVQVLTATPHVCAVPCDFTHQIMIKPTKSRTVEYTKSPEQEMRHAGFYNHMRIRESIKPIFLVKEWPPASLHSLGNSPHAILQVENKPGFTWVVINRACHDIISVAVIYTLYFLYHYAVIFRAARWWNPTLFIP